MYGSELAQLEARILSGALVRDARRALKGGIKMSGLDLWPQNQDRGHKMFHFRTHDMFCSTGSGGHRGHQPAMILLPRVACKCM